MAADTTQNTLCHVRQGGDRLEVASGGSIVADSGSTVTLAGTNSDGTTDLAASFLEINRAAQLSTRPVTISGSTTITAAAHSDRVCMIPSGSATITLPAMSGSGARYKFAMSASLSSATITITATGAHLFGGVLQNTDTAAGTLFTTNVAANPSGSTNIILNGGTTGGRKGDWIEIFDGASSIGIVSGCLNASGTEATPFS